MCFFIGPQGTLLCFPHSCWTQSPRTVRLPLWICYPQSLVRADSEEGWGWSWGRWDLTADLWELAKVIEPREDWVAGAGRISLSLAPLPDCRISSFLLGPLAVPSWEDAPRMPHLPPPVHKTKVPLAMASSLFRAHELPSSQSQSSGPSGNSPDTGTRAVASRDIDRGGLGVEPVPGTEGPFGFPLHLSGGDGLAPTGQLMDVSQLLRLYQARGWGALPAQDLLLYLKRQEHGRYQPGGRWQGGAAHGQPGSDRDQRAGCGPWSHGEASIVPSRGRK